MTSSTIMAILPYIAPIILPIITDITFDLLPGKYVGKLRKLFKYTKLIQANKGKSAKNTEAWQEYDSRLAKIKILILSAPFDTIVGDLTQSIDRLATLTKTLGENGILTDAALTRYSTYLQHQESIVTSLHAIFNETIGKKEG